MCVLLYWDLDRTMHLRVIRAGREGWTGLSSCTFDRFRMSHASIPRVPHSLVQRHRSQQHRHLYLLPHSWGFHWKARTPTDTWRPYRVSTGLTSSVAWTGSEEANDFDYFYTMDRTGSEVKGQAWLKIRDQYWAQVQFFHPTSPCHYHLS